jgi:hypothetical protein
LGTIIDRLLILLAACMGSVRKRTGDDVTFFVFISGHEHRPLAPIPALTRARRVNILVWTYFRQYKRIEKATISISVEILYCSSVSPRTEVQGKGLRDL